MCFVCCGIRILLQTPPLVRPFRRNDDDKEEEEEEEKRVDIIALLLL